MSEFVEVSQSARPMSPCISICALDVTGHCAGCLRTRDEIANWIRMTPAQQWDLLRTLDDRRTRRSGKSV
jgi:predicted Fe-S protein YdhL (DUF1289 family)